MHIRGVSKLRVITVDADNGKQVFNKTEVATICGVSPQTIRLWETAGKIPKSTRDENGYRYWYEEDLEIIKSVGVSSKGRYKR